MALKAIKKIANHLKTNGAFLSFKYNFFVTKNRQKKVTEEVTKEMITSPKTAATGVMK